MTDTLAMFTQDQLTNARSLDYVRLVSCLGIDGNGSAARLSDELDRIHAAEVFLGRWPRSLSSDLLGKAATWQHKGGTTAGSTTEPAWAAALAPVRPLMEAFVEMSRPASLIGKLLPLSKQVPFNVSVPAATSGATVRWVGQAGAKPVGNMQLASATLPIAKVAGIIVVTRELMTLTAPASVTALRRELSRGISQYLDQQLTDPTVAAVTNVSPASITNAAPSIASAGTSSANVLTDIKKLVETFTATNPDSESMAMLMSPRIAVAAAIATNSTTLGINGGMLFGIPVLTGYVGNRVIVLDPSALLIADEGDMDVTVARHASIEMETSATSPPVAGTVMVSLFQLGLVGLIVDRVLSYRMARADAALFTNVAWV
jgi:hypothetical protein